MTISTTGASIIAIATGSSNTFNFPFIGVVASDIYVNVGAVSASAFTVSLNAPVTGQIWGVGGSVTVSGALIPIGTLITLGRNLPLTQNTSLSNQGDMWPQTVEAALDTLCMQIQQAYNRTTQFRGTWLANTAYNVGDIVQDGANGLNTLNYYICQNSNISSVWATDLSAGDWAISVVATVPGGVINVTGAVTGTQVGSTIATTLANNIVGLNNLQTNAVGNAKLATMPANTIKGNNTGAATNPIDLTTSQVVSMLGITTPSIAGSRKNLKILWASTSTINITSDQVMLQTTGTAPFAANNVNLTLNSATTGANGIDTGSVSANSWYYIFVIYNPTTTTTSCLMSLSSTSPSLPSGYTFFARVGSVRTDSSNLFIGFTQYGQDWQYFVGGNLTLAPKIVIAGTNIGNPTTGPTTVAQSISNFCPPTSGKIKMAVTSSGSGDVCIVSPNQNWGPWASITNTSFAAITNNSTNGAPFDMILESSNVYFACNGGGNVLYCYGFTDNL